MCLIVFSWQPEHPQTLIVAANRDEFYERPAHRLERWGDPSGVLAGRDLAAGGTWFGINRTGQFAALTNIRDPKRALGERSRGELVQGFLQGTQSPLEYLRALTPRSGLYAGFNLLLGDAEGLYFFNSRQKTINTLAPGIYGLSNANLDTPWPKLTRSKRALETLQHPSCEALLTLLHDHWQPADNMLPDTGVGLEFERLLGRTFIHSATYGTRASTALICTQDGAYQLCERSFGPEGVVGEVSFSGRFSLVPSLQD